MAKRIALSKHERATHHGAALYELCERITQPGKLSEEGIRELLRWLRDNRSVKLPAVQFLSATIAAMVTDRAISVDEQKQLHLAVERVLPPDSRKKSAAARKDRDLEDSGVVLFKAQNGRKYNLDQVVSRVEYGEYSLGDVREQKGADVAAVVEQRVRARERHFTGWIVRETDGGAWVFRLMQGGEFVVPISAARVLSGTPPGPLTIAVVGSFLSEVDRQLSRPAAFTN